ncbi:MAG TPA: tRNA (guanosine(37)-N1)-methyltransferase TrmD [Candidatus Woesebacteria bacterium]|nr:tRNA (guanosine(37)-N1)-methyltransferase TrmD [Candidatus Woesebacteria bacterium]
MKISIITLFPDMIRPFLDESIMKRAQEKGAVKIEIINLRDFALDDHGTVDDRPYGGGAGMVLRPEPLVQAIKSLRSPRSARDDKQKIILTSAKGKSYSQKKAHALAKLDHFIIICGHYEGVDERIMDHIDEEISLGDYVLTGGEIAASAIVDSVVRLLPGVLKKDEATTEESFFEVSVAELISAVGEITSLTYLREIGVQTVQLLEYPHYTRPVQFEGKQVPTVLTKGNHEEIRKWRIKEAYNQTMEKRPDLLSPRYSDPPVGGEESR